MKNLLSELSNSDDFDPQLEQLILKLQSQLRNSKGKKVYGYLQPNVKKTVNQIVAGLAKNPVLKKMYEEWCNLEEEKYSTYTGTVPKLPELAQNDVFKPIKNAVIQAVLAMDYAAIEPVETEQNQNNIGEQNPNNSNIQNPNQNNVQGVILNALEVFGKLVSDDYNNNLRNQKLHTESKLKSTIRRKKQALGLKENPLESLQLGE